MLYRPGTLVLAKAVKGLRTVMGCKIPFRLKSPEVPQLHELISIPNDTLLVVVRQGCILLGESSTQYEVMLPDATFLWVWASCLIEVSSIQCP